MPRCSCHDPAWRPGKVGTGHARLCPQARTRPQVDRLVYDDGIVYSGAPTMDGSAYSPMRMRPAQ